jgi:hypothetical protein
MTVEQIRAIAKNLGINPARLKKADLIKTIQRTEGNFDCFGTSSGVCDQFDCLWRDDCLKSGAT